MKKNKSLKMIYVFIVFLFLFIDINQTNSIPHEVDIENICQKSHDGQVMSVFDATGSLIVEGRCLNRHKHGTWHVWSQDGEMRIYFFRQNQPYTQGQANRKIHFTREDQSVVCNHEPDGKMTTYYENKKIKTRAFCQGGLSIGKEESLYEDGHQKYIIYFNDKGYFDGEYFLWNEEGIVISEGFYKNGKRHGRWLRRSENGTIISEENYNEGPLHGVQILYDETTGEIFQRCYYEENDIKSCDIGGDGYFDDDDDNDD
jgi:hypothetical protein